MKGLYIHLPFCKSKCPYCGFYSTTDSYQLQEKYFRALINDLRTRDDRRYDTLYIGGGTPSTVNLDLLAALLDWLSVQFQGHFSESTIEANPESLSDDFLKIVNRYKFSRISVGSQSTSNDILKKLGRMHSAEDIFTAAEKIRRLCPETALNLDMIFDIPDVDSAITLKTISDLISINPEHISAYSYSHDREFLPVYDNDNTDYMLVREKLTEAGYQKYEISNFAKPGFESIHNTNYWNLGSYDGAGASAWTLENLPDKRVLKGKTSDIVQYIENPTDYAEVSETSGKKLVIENIVFGLRKTEGICIEKITANSDAVFSQKIYNIIEILANKELVEWSGKMLKLSLQGELLLDSVQSFFWERLP